MKKLLYLVAALLVGACSRNALSDTNPFEMPSLTADAFVAALADGTYASRSLPAFTAADIEGLLAHRLDPRPVSTHPFNPISSYRSESVALGFVVLWAIENIRRNHPYTGSTIENFPSQNPVLQPRNGSFEPITDIASLEVAAAAYQAWWEANQDQPFAEARLVDPLAELDLRWH